MSLCFTALGTRSMLTVEEHQGSQYMEPEARLWESLPVMNQICKLNEHKFCPVRNIRSVQCMQLETQAMFIFLFGWGLCEMAFFRIPEVVSTDTKQESKH